MVKVKTNSLYHRPKRSSNNIRILQTEFEFGKNEFNIPKSVFLLCAIFLSQMSIYASQAIMWKISASGDSRCSLLVASLTNVCMIRPLSCHY